MGQALLVEMDLRIAANLAEELDRRNLDVRVILVAKFDEYSEARLVLASPSFESHDPRFNYQEFGGVLREIGDEEVPLLLLMEMSDPFVIALRETLGAMESKQGLRLSQYALGDRFVEDGYAYRVR